MKILNITKNKFLSFIGGLDDNVQSQPDKETPRMHTNLLFNFFKFCIMIVLIFLAFTSLFTFVINFWNVNTISMIITVAPVLLLMLFALITTLFKKITRKQAFVISIILIAINVTLAAISNFLPIWDGLNLAYTLSEMNQGIYTTLNHHYYKICTNQLKFLMFLDIFNLLPKYFYPFNMVAYVIGFITIGKLSDQINRNATRHAWLLYAGYLPFALYMGSYYRDMIGAVLIMIFVYNIIRIAKNNAAHIHYAMAFVSFFVGYIVQDWILIPLIATVIVFTLYRATTKRDEIKKLILVIICFLSVAATPMLTKTYFKSIHNFDVPESNSEVSWLVMGNLPIEYNYIYNNVSVDSNVIMYEGQYNDYLFNYWLISDEYRDIKVIKQMAKDDLKELVGYWSNQPSKYAKFLSNKLIKQWEECTVEGWANGSSYKDRATRDMSTMTNHPIAQAMIFNNSSYMLFAMLFKGMWTYIYCALCFMVIKKRKLSIAENMLLITMIGAFAFSAIHEAKPRYVMPFMILLLPMAADWINAHDSILKLAKRKTDDINTKD